MKYTYKCLDCFMTFKLNKLIDECPHCKKDYLRIMKLEAEDAL